MSGKHNGVQTLFRKETKNPCIFVHCYAHRLNLVLSIAASEVSCAKNYFDLLRRTTSFINGSCKGKEVFKDLQNSDPDVKEAIVLPDMCDQKGIFHERSVDAVHYRYNHLVESLDSISETGKPDDRAEAEGLLKQWMLPMNVCLMVIFLDLFAQLNPLSTLFQAKKTDLSAALQLAHTTLLNTKRCNST